jgi:hypothetical protein
MNASSNPELGAVLPLVTLVPAEDRLLVAPLPEDGGTACTFEPFPLWVPAPLIDRLLYLNEALWTRHQRCMGHVLLVRTTDRSVGFYTPRQRVAADSASWSLSAPDVCNEGRAIRAVGTLQSRVLGAREEPIDAVPPVPGAHLVAVIKGHTRELWSFVRDEQSTRLVSPGLFIDEQREDSLESILERLTFV